MMNIKEFYNSKLKEMPDFSDFDREFCISGIEEGDFGRRICEKIVEKTERFRKLLEDFLKIDGSSVSAMMEMKGMNEKDNDRINHIYKEIMIIEKEALLAELESDEKAFLKFIKESYNKWNSIKPDIKEIILKARESWNKNRDIKEEIKYFG